MNKATDFFEEDKIPLHFSDAFLEGKHLNLQQVVFWDETHKKVHIGKGSKTVKSEVRFPRDSDNKIDLVNGTYAKRSTYLQVKYPEEV